MTTVGPSKTTFDPEALEADRAAARTSDQLDGRDGVDASDALTGDPDAVGGKPPEGKPGRRRLRSSRA